MKNLLLLNAPIISVLATLGHTNTITIADCGLPIPDSTQRIDLALKPGVPGFLETLDTILAEFKPESAILAEEIKTASPDMTEAILKRLEGIPVQFISHAAFKQASAQARACVRTGECTPYTNIILVAASLF